MTSSRIWVLALFVLASAGCGRCATAGPERTTRADDAPAAEAAAEPHGDDDTLQIAPEMLRDLRITTSPVEVRTGAQVVNALGELQVNQDAYAEVAAPLAGRVVELPVTVGQVVRSGQALAVVHSPELARTRSEWHGGQARKTLADQVLRRKRGLLAERVVAAREVEEAEAEAAAADAAVSAAASALAALGVSDPAETVAHPSQLTLRAPLGGTVIARELALGQMVDGSRSVMRIADLSALWLVVHAFERDAVRVAPGARGVASFPALPGQTFEGRVTYVGRQVEADSGTVPVRLRLTAPASTLRPGMAASADIQVGSTDASILSVPMAALHRLADNWVAFVPRGEGAFEIRIVGRGRDLGREVEVLRGLSAGESVVVEGAFVLKAEAEKQRGGGADEH
jgi:cobalt-zinc-cadmium efflux system membrane fusion protein